MAQVSTDELILEIQNRLADPHITDEQIDKYRRILRILKEED